MTLKNRLFNIISLKTTRYGWEKKYTTSLPLPLELYKNILLKIHIMKTSLKVVLLLL